MLQVFRITRCSELPRATFVTIVDLGVNRGVNIFPATSGQLTVVFCLRVLSTVPAVLATAQIGKRTSQVKLAYILHICYIDNPMLVICSAYV